MIEVRIRVDDVVDVADVLDTIPMGHRPVVEVIDDGLLLAYDFTEPEGVEVDDEPEPEPEPTSTPKVDVLALHPEGGRPLASLPEPDEDDPSSMSCADAIVDLLTTEPDEAFTAPELAAELTRWTKGTVAFTLGQLHREGRIERVKRGAYKAAS